MFNNAHLDRLRQSFADQFSDGEHGVIYRKYQKGVPFRVSKAERDGFVAVFNKRIRYATWSIFPVTVGLILLLVWLTPGSDSPVAQIAMWGGIAAILLPFMVIFYWAWGAPSRELECQTPEGPALTKEEARALAFSKITYGQLALAALMGVGLIWKMSVLHQEWPDWAITNLSLSTAMSLLSGRILQQAYRGLYMLARAPKVMVRLHSQPCSCAAYPSLFEPQRQIRADACFAVQHTRQSYPRHSEPVGSLGN